MPVYAKVLVASLVIKAIPHYWHRNSGFGGSSDVSNIGFQISYVFIVGRYVRVWGLKRPQKTSNKYFLRP